ncbi:MAG: DEAD/DEAH box helicase [Butyrivibrio sp.]|nr:DEAD/DEAH box helicase [Butyrivibrio sp.]
MSNNSRDNFTNGYISGSGRRFVSDAPGQFHYTSFETKRLLREYEPKSDVPMLYRKEALVELEPHASLSRDRLTISFNIRSGSTGHSYVLKDIIELLHAISEKNFVSYGKHLQFTHDISAFTEDSARIIRFLYAYFREKQLADPYTSYSGSGEISYSYAKGHAKQIELTGHEIDEFFKAATSVYFINTDFRARYTNERPLEVVKVFPPIDLRIRKTENGITFESDAFTMFEGYSYIFFERKRMLHMIDRSDCEAIIPFMRFLLARRTENELFISDKDLPLFSTGLFPILSEYFNVSCLGYEPEKYSPDVPEFGIYIDMPDDGSITCDVKATYRTSAGDISFSILSGDGHHELDDNADIKRNYYLENSTAKLISPYFDKKDEEKGIFVLNSDEYGDDRLYSFLAEDMPGLSRFGEIYLSENVNKVKITKAPGIRMGVSVVSDLLELSLVSDDISPEELAEIINKYDRKKKYHKLKNGEIIDLRSGDMDTLFALKDGLGLTGKDIIQGYAKVPSYRALFIDSLTRISGDGTEFEEAEGRSRIGKSKDFKKLIESLSGIGEKTYEVPDSLKDTLRDYQKAGYLWLQALKHNGFGGILADDMGLGKTLQVLALLLSLKKEAEGKHKCSLIVCPASLVYNWKHEIERFTGELKAELAVGIKPDRERILSELEEEATDVVITSYDLLRRDIDLYRYKSFECMIIDEAQFIKNPGTLGSKAVKSISASFKVALTGTPIENRLSELWSIFDFCMPGYLFTYKHFHDNIELPLVSEKDEAARDRLKKMIAPFVLRRLKKDVLKDLPEKLEENIYASMTDEQERLYKAHLQRVKLMVDSKSEEDIKKDRIVILSELTRLRQICCDPGLIYDNYKGGSAKADLLIEMIKSAAEGGHKILLFSQFTTMLERITELLKKEGIAHYLLTGATKKEDRIRLVDAFQEDDTPVFCISLRAGGTGLNLTAADIVIHFDHWWNIAVENQATDRAHRIGQKNVVTVYRLIMQDTIEERIIHLQNKKKELADELLNEGKLGSAALTKEQLRELLG